MLPLLQICEGNFRVTDAPAETVIQARRGWSLPNFREIFEYRDLLRFLVLRDLKVKYRQTALGVLWAVLQPLQMMAVMWLVFGKVLGLSSDGLPYPLFCLAGLVLWTYFAQTVSTASASVISHVQLIEKVYFPRLLIPLAATLSGLPNLLISFVLLMALMVVYGVAPGQALLMCVPLAAMTALLAFGTGAAFAALSVRYRDIPYVVPIMLQLWLYITPVIYSTSAVPEKWRFLLAVNPMTGIVEAFRVALFNTGTDVSALFLMSCIGVVVVVPLGLIIFGSLERDFADVI